MIEQLKTIREFVESVHEGEWAPYVSRKATLAALAEIESMVGEPVAWVDERAIAWIKDHPRGKITTTLEAKESYERPMAIYTAAPVAQQYEAGDMASAAAQGFRDGVASVAQQPQAEAVPLTHVLVPVEPTDEMVDAACAAVDGLCRVDFVRAYVAAFAHLKAGYRDESYWCGWNAAIKFQQAEAVPVVDRVYEAAKRLVDHADFQLGGVLSAKSKARDIPSNAASKVKARHLASLRDALAKTPHQAEAVQYTRADLDRAYSAGLVEGERLAIQQAEAVPPGYVLVPVEPTPEMQKAGEQAWADAYSLRKNGIRQIWIAMAKEAAIAQQKGGV